MGGTLTAKRNEDMITLDFPLNPSQKMVRTIIQTSPLLVFSHELITLFLNIKYRWKTCLAYMWPSRIIREPPGNTARLPSETEPPGCENTKKKKKTNFKIIFQTIIFVHMYGNNSHLLLEGN